MTVAFSPDGRKLAVSLSYPNGYPEVEVWNSGTLARRYRALPLNALGGEADCLAWSSDGTYLYLAGDLAAGSPASLVVRVGRGGQDEENFETVRACGEQTQCFITGILALRDGRVLFAASNQSGLGLLDGQWKVEKFQAAPLPVYVGLEDNGRFLVSDDGLSVRFAYQEDGAQPCWFSVARRLLAPGAAVEGFAGKPPDDRSIEVHGLGSEEIKLKGSLLDILLDIDGETGLRVAAAGGAGGLVLGSQWSLFRFDGQGKRQRKIVLPGNAEAVNVSGDGRFVVAALSDGTIRWFGLADGAERLAFFPHPGLSSSGAKLWILWTPEGYYDCSPGAEDLLGYQTDRGEGQPPDFQTAGELRAKYYKPEVVALALR